MRVEKNIPSLFAKSSVEVMMMIVIVVGEVLVNNGAKCAGDHRKDTLSSFVLQMISDCLRVLCKSHGACCSTEQLIIIVLF